MEPASRLDESILQTLYNQLQGSVLRPSDESYNEVRALWNNFFDRKPAVIAQCANSDDVIAAVSFARENDVPLSVKSGGHSYAGTSVGDRGLTVDLSQLDHITINSEAKTARVEPGVKWASFDKAAQEVGLATTGCTVSSVGVAGYALGGGSGYLARKHGLCADNLLSAEVVTANGELVHASETENEDLFWALRGGSGNFGIVTSFEFQLHEVGPEVIAGQIVHSFEDVAEVLRFYRDFTSDAPDELTCYPFILNVPPIDAFPEEYQGKPALFLVIGYAGSVTEGEEVLQPLQEFGDPILNMVGPMSYTAMQQMFDEGMVPGRRCYSRAHYLNSISDAAIETVARYTEELPGPFTAAYLEPMGGAINRVDPGVTAFPHRGAAYGFHILAGWAEPEEDNNMIAWARKFHEAMAAHATGGVYVNLLSQDEQGRVPKAYGSNYKQLVEIKKKWDPDNLFSHNHNIPPAGHQQHTG